MSEIKLLKARYDTYVKSPRKYLRWIIEGNAPTCPTCRRLLNGSERAEGDAMIFRVDYLWDDILASIKLVNRNSE